MKVLHLRDYYLGITFLYYILKGLGENHKILVRRVDKKDIEMFPDVEVIAIPWFYRLLDFFDRILRVLTRSDHKLINFTRGHQHVIDDECPDILHAHMGHEGLYSLPLVLSTKLPFVVTLYGADLALDYYPYWRRHMPAVYARGDAFVVEGPVMKKTLVTQGVEENKIHVIEIPILPEKIPLKSSFYHKDNLKIFMCSAFIEKKGIDIAIQALAQLNFDYEVHIVGSGPLESVYSSMIKDLGVEENFIFHGRKKYTEVYEIALTCDVFLHPSKLALNGDTEGGAPTVIIEMQYLGLPIVATTHADIPHVVIDSDYLCTENSVVELVASLEKFIANWRGHNVLHISNLENNRKQILAKHSSTIIANKYQALYGSLLESRTC